MIDTLWGNPTLSLSNSDYWAFSSILLLISNSHCCQRMYKWLAFSWTCSGDQSPCRDATLLHRKIAWLLPPWGRGPTGQEPNFVYSLHDIKSYARFINVSCLQTELNLICRWILTRTGTLVFENYGFTRPLCGRNRSWIFQVVVTVTAGT
jgi:hypothetical protein